MRDLQARARAITAHAAVSSTRPPATAVASPGEPLDLQAIYAVTDGLELADGTRILGRDEIGPATAWLVRERALEWGDDLWVVGERDDLVLVRDIDLAGARASGGVIEAPTDGLSRLSRQATHLVSYLEARLGLLPIDAERAPELAARDAVLRGDAEAIAIATARPFYPGSERELAHAALTLGALRARDGADAAAMEAFARSIEARVRAAPRGAEASERRAAWRACAIAAERAGAPLIAAACRERALGS